MRPSLPSLLSAAVLVRSRCGLNHDANIAALVESVRASAYWCPTGIPVVWQPVNAP